MIDLREKILAGADALDRRDAFDPEDRAQYMNASEAMYCLRRQWYMKHLPQPEQDWGYARRGKVIEAWNVDCMRAAGLDIRLAGEQQETIYSDAHQLSATPDGVIVSNQHLSGVELKSIDPRANKANLPKKGHTEQLQIGMALIDLIKADLGLPDLPWDGSFIHYTDASNLNEQVQFPVRFDAGILDRMKPRASRLFAARSADSLPREGKLAGGTECRLCPFSGPCGVIGSGSDTGSSEGKASRLSKAVGDYLDGKQMETAGAELKSAAAERIKTALRHAKKTMDTIDGHTVSLTEVAGRKTLDRAAVEAAGIDLTPFEKEGAPSERLTVK